MTSTFSRGATVLLVLCASTALFSACDALLGVSVCDKACSSASDCGDGYQCTGGVCVSEGCGNLPANNTSSSSMSSSSSSSSSSSTSSSSSSSSGSSSSSSSSSGGASSGMASSGASSTGGMSTMASSSMMASSSVMTGCTLVGGDSCALATTNRLCLSEGGTCGCMTAGDCASGELCTGNTCTPCNSESACGTDCQPCRATDPDAGLMSLAEYRFYRCNGNTEPAATACVVDTCAAGSANCDGSDGANACETDVGTTRSACGSCGVTCSGTNACTNGQCRCNQSPNTCPMGQACRSTRCECDNDGQCAPGYTCNTGTNICQRG